MAGTLISTVDELQHYLLGVARRADHHAGKVGEIVMAVAGCVVMYKDPESELRVMARNGETKNVLWVKIKGERYALSYNHEDQQIEVREGSVCGDMLTAFDNDSSVSDVIEFFQELRVAV